MYRIANLTLKVGLRLDFLWRFIIADPYLEQISLHIMDSFQILNTAVFGFQQLTLPTNERLQNVQFRPWR